MEGRYISIGNKCVVGKYATLSCWRRIPSSVPDLVIGNFVSIGEGCHITCANKIVIGDCTLLGKYITINANITNTMNGRVISRELQKINTNNDFATNR